MADFVTADAEVLRWGILGTIWGVPSNSSFDLSELINKRPIWKPGSKISRRSTVNWALNYAGDSYRKWHKELRIITITIQWGCIWDSWWQIKNIDIKERRTQNRTLWNARGWYTSQFQLTVVCSVGQVTSEPLSRVPGESQTSKFPQKDSIMLDTIESFREV